MDASSYVGVIGGIIICMFSILIAMIVDLKKDFRCIKNELSGKVEKTDCIRETAKQEEKFDALKEKVWGMA
jgi:hypothetical protein